MSTLAAPSRKTGIPANPLVKKLWSVDCTAENVATYAGVYKKCLFFLIMTAVGVCLSVFFSVTGAISVEAGTGELLMDDLVIWMLLGAAGIFLVFPFLAFLLRVTIPVTGSLYCASVGFLFGFVALLDEELGGYIVLALALTVAVVAVMGFLFSKGYIRASAKFRTFSTTAFFAMILGSLLMLVCYFVPALRGAVLFLANNPVLNIIAAVTGLIIAIMFLLVDFENVRSVVENRLPKKYEWYASFGLAFTVVWVYLKILHLIMKLKDTTN